MYTQVIGVFTYSRNRAINKIQELLQSYPVESIKSIQEENNTCIAIVEVDGNDCIVEREYIKIAWLRPSENLRGYKLTQAWVDSQLEQQHDLIGCVQCSLKNSRELHYF